MNRVFIVCLFIIYVMCINITHSYASKLNITSDNLRIQNDNLTASFSGNVKLVFSDFELFTTKLIVVYSDTSNKKDIKKIIIPTQLKAVRLCNGEIIIADSGEFDNLMKKLTLEKNVRMLKDGNTLVTDKVVYSSYFKKIQSDSNAK